jgi:glycosyltransferase involved in cell wall biosynthesis
MSMPAVSVIVPAYNAVATVGRCLAALETQTAASEAEVIVADSSSDGTAALVAERFPRVRLLAFPTRRFPGDARNRAIAAARAGLLAFTDADCIADPRWLETILAAHRAEADPVIGGAIENGNPESRVGWAAYLLEFSQWIPSHPRGHMPEIPTGCLSLKRWAFERYGPFLEGTYSSDSAFTWRLTNDGHQPLFEPAMRVAHVNIDRLGDLVRRKLRHGRDFARLRVRAEGFSTVRRAAFAALAAGLPALLWSRIARRVSGDRHLRARLAGATPALVVGLVAWSLGEALGYLASSAARSEVDPPLSVHARSRT